MKRTEQRRGSAVEVFNVFLRLGLTSFGGPVAHLGYYRAELVTRRQWLDDAAYADLVTLCQFLPGPASSQTGFAIGLMRAGLPGALAAFAAFSLPSVMLMAAFAAGAGALDVPVGQGVIGGLKLVAVAIVGQAVLGMARNLCPDTPRALLAVAAMTVLALLPGAAGMLAAIGLGAAAGLALGPPSGPRPEAGRADAPGPRIALPRGVAPSALVLAFALLGLLPLLAALGPLWSLADGFYRAGALVFGGGHVVLPLLQAEMVPPGLVAQDAFLAGYGAAQALPGPIFTFATYLGILAAPPGLAVAAAAVATLAIFLPGFLLLLGILPLWDRLRRDRWARAALSGTNAAVVGILAAALYDPIFTTAVTDPLRLALAAAGFVLLVVARLPGWAVVLLGAGAGAVLGLTGL